jgi:hypothetical protein
MARSRPLPVLQDHGIGVRSATVPASSGASCTTADSPVISPAGVVRSALEAEGWVWRFATAPPRLDEMADLYRSLGHEVRLEPLGADEPIGGIEPIGPGGSAGTSPGAADCTACNEARAAFRTIYTRRLK